MIGVEFDSAELWIACRLHSCFHMFACQHSMFNGYVLRLMYRMFFGSHCATCCCCFFCCATRFIPLYVTNSSYATGVKTEIIENIQGYNRMTCPFLCCWWKGLVVGNLHIRDRGLVQLSINQIMLVYSTFCATYKRHRVIPEFRRA